MNNLKALFLVYALLAPVLTYGEDCSEAFFKTNFKHALELRKKHLEDWSVVKFKRLYERYYEIKLPVLMDKLVSCHKKEKRDNYIVLVLEFLLSIRGESTEKTVTVMNRLYKLTPKVLTRLILKYEKKEALYLTKLLNFSWENANSSSKKPKVLIQLNALVNQK